MAAKKTSPAAQVPPIPLGERMWPTGAPTTKSPPQVQTLSGDWNFGSCEPGGTIIPQQEHKPPQARTSTSESSGQRRSSSFFYAANGSLGFSSGPEKPFPAEPKPIPSGVGPPPGKTPPPEKELKRRRTVDLVFSPGQRVLTSFPKSPSRRVGIVDTAERNAVGIWVTWAHPRAGRDRDWVNPSDTRILAEEAPPPKPLELGPPPPPLMNPFPVKHIEHSSVNVKNETSLLSSSPASGTPPPSANSPSFGMHSARDTGSSSSALTIPELQPMPGTAVLAKAPDGNWHVGRVLMVREKVPRSKIWFDEPEVRAGGATEPWYLEPKHISLVAKPFEPMPGTNVRARRQPGADFHEGQVTMVRELYPRFQVRFFDPDVNLDTLWFVDSPDLLPHPHS